MGGPGHPCLVRMMPLSRTFHRPSCAQNPRRVLHGGERRVCWKGGLGCFEVLGVLVTNGVPLITSNLQAEQPGPLQGLVIYGDVS